MNASATCPTCETIHTNLPFERDETGGYAVLEVMQCAECGTLLCECCDQFDCDGCGHAHCLEHLIVVPDSTDRPLRCCNNCACEADPLPLPFPPARETRIAAVLEVA